MIDQRLKSLRESLKANKIDALLISSAVNIDYLTGYSNFSRIEREAYLFVTEQDATLFTDGRYIEAVEKVLPANITSTIKPISLTINQMVKGLNIKSASWRIGFESNLTYAEFKKFEKKVDVEFILIEYLIEDLRIFKDDDEILSLKHAAKLTDETFEYIKKRVRTGVTEREIANEIEQFIKKNGGELAFESIIAFGPNSSIPHHETSNKKLEESDEFILLDFGAKVAGYHADMTRTILTRKASTKAKKIYETVLGAQETAINYLNSNKRMSGRMAFEIASGYIVKRGFPKMPHGLGHGIGLEVHESPRLSKKAKDYIKNGMVFTIEPGIYIPGFGGVRIEDDYLLNEQKMKQLTKSPK